MAENLYDIPTAPRRTAREFFGDIREGFTAGLTNRDPRFSREEKQKALTQATLQDAEEIRRAIQSNNMRKATDILVDRANLLEGMGESAEDTYALRDMIVSGNAENALGEIDTFINAATRRGLIKPPTPIESKYVSTDSQGRLGTVMPVAGGGTRFEPSTGAPAKPVEPTEYRTYTSGGIERYADGPYAGYSLGRVAELQRTGQLGKFGDQMPSMTPRAAEPAPEVRPPMRMPATPATGAADLYAGLSSQEAAILQAEQEELSLQRERAKAEEERRKAEEERAVAEELRTAAASEEQESLARNEALSVLGLLRGRFLNPAVYGDAIYNAATGPIEGNQEGASLTSYLPFGASPQEVTNFSDDFNNLNNLLTVGNLGRLKGVLSDSDIALIRDAASGLKRTSSPELLKARMAQIEAVISDRLRTKFGLTDEQIEAQLPLFSTGGGELDALIDKFNTPSTTSSTRRGPR
jgi:hypothetical protein